MTLPDRFRFLALGDSYTIGEGVSPQDRWPDQLAAHWQTQLNRPVEVQIVATTGWRTDNLANALTIARLLPTYDKVSLLIGVNNQYQHRSVEVYAVEFEELLGMAIGLVRGKTENVFVVSNPDYGFTPYGAARREEISPAIDAFNAVNRTLAARRGVAYVDITGLSREGLAHPDWVVADGLHPSGQMYARWAAHIAAAVPLV